MFRTNAGTKLWAVSRTHVTFEVDDLDVKSRSGWSVMVRGAAREVTSADDPWASPGHDAAPVIPWAPGQRDHLVRIVADDVTGRRIHLPQRDEDEAATGWNGGLIWPHMGPI